MHTPVPVLNPFEYKSFEIKAFLIHKSLLNVQVGTIYFLLPSPLSKRAVGGLGNNYNTSLGASLF